MSKLVTYDIEGYHRTVVHAVAFAKLCPPKGWVPLRTFAVAVGWWLTPMHSSDHRKVVVVKAAPLEAVVVIIVGFLGSEIRVDSGSCTVAVISVTPYIIRIRENC